MRYVALVILVVCVLSGCSSSPDIPPQASVPPAPTLTSPTSSAAPPTTTVGASTPYENTSLGIMATLPGTDWVLNQAHNDALLDSYISNTPDGKYVLSITRRNGTTPTTDSQYKGMANFIKGGLTQPASLTHEEFHGYSALKVEGVNPGSSGASEGQHEINYLMIVDGKILIFTLGVRASEWDNGGKEVATRILDSVRIK